MEKKTRRAAHASQGGGLLRSFRRPRRGGRRAHAVAPGKARAARVATAVAVLAVAGSLLALAPVAPASAATTASPALATSEVFADVPGREGWFEGVESLFEQAWDNVLDLGARVVAELEVQLAQLGSGAADLWGLLP